ncbi:hypothetical protein KKG71_03095, partial [Patescibacteria group bacterium]|nr:hypothetical protein [Patescibacteria group bacterium]
PPLSHGSQTSTSKLPDFRETDKKGEMLERLNNMLLGSFSGLIEEKLGEKIELKTFEDKMRLYRILQKYWKSRKLDGKNGKVNLSKTAHSKLLYNHMRANLKKEDLNVTKKESEFSADDLN